MMVLSKQHYIKIADILRKNKILVGDGVTMIDYNIIEDLCIYFYQENNNFDEDKFKDAIK